MIEARTRLLRLEHLDQLTNMISLTYIGTRDGGTASLPTQGTVAEATTNRGEVDHMGQSPLYWLHLRVSLAATHSILSRRYLISTESDSFSTHDCPVVAASVLLRAAHSARPPQRGGGISTAPAVSLWVVNARQQKAFAL